MSCINETYYQGDTIIVPIEYEQGQLTDISGFNDFDKIDIKLKSDLSDTFVFSTDKTDDYKIEIIDPNNMELIIPLEATEKMLGNVIADVKYEYTYKTRPMVSSDVNISTNIIIAKK